MKRGVKWVRVRVWVGNNLCEKLAILASVTTNRMVAIFLETIR